MVATDQCAKMERGRFASVDDVKATTLKKKLKIKKKIITLQEVHWPHLIMAIIPLMIKGLD